MKLTNQLAVVIVAGIVGILGLVIGLAVLAKWSDVAIIGMVTAFGAVIVNTVVAVRAQQKTAEVLRAQDDKLDTITTQTNGQADIERKDIAAKAAAATIAQLKKDGHL